MEELTDAPERTMKSLFSWLNVDSSFVSPDFHQPKNVTPEVVNMATHFGVAQRMRKSRLGRFVTPHIPYLIRRIGVGLTTKTINRRTVDRLETIEFLRPIQQKQTEELTCLLGREFAEWSTLYSQSPDGHTGFA